MGIRIIRENRGKDNNQKLIKPTTTRPKTSTGRRTVQTHTKDRIDKIRRI